jgi:dienelactone hydrolase
MHARYSFLFLICASLASPASQSGSVASLLSTPILETNLPLAEVQAYTESRVPLMPNVSTVAEWEKLAKKMREDALNKVVFRGKAADWRQQKTRLEWLETIPGGPGYHIRKLRYEAVPGFWIPALLYEPDNLSGKVPVMLNVNGHEGIGKAVGYKQIRCINEVKRGMLALNPEWIGMGQLRGTNYQHYRMNQLDLCGTSGVSPFYLAMARGLDILLAHKNADASRVAVSGLSGGGWQTIFISSLDPRVKLANPVAGYSSFRTRARFLEDLGDSEQTPCDLATAVDYAHLTAMMAPRPTLLTFNAKDNCCFASPHAMQPLVDAAGPVFKLYGRENALRTHVNYDPGDHNFGQDNRQAFYRMLGDFFTREEDGFSAVEIPSESEVKTYEELQVALPEDNADFNSVARDLSRDLPRQAKLPTSKGAAEKWQDQNRGKLREVVRAKHFRAVGTRVDGKSVDGVEAAFWKIKVDDEWTVPAVELTSRPSKQTTLLVADSGRSGAAAEAQALLEKGERVLAVDPFYFGESKIRTHDYLFALLVAAVGERPLALQAGQIAAVARWAKSQPEGQAVKIRAVGPRASTFALIAAALETNAVAGVELSGALGSFKELIETNESVSRTPELFCFGLLEAFDVKQIVALVAPRPVHFANASERVKAETAELQRWYGMFGQSWQ